MGLGLIALLVTAIGEYVEGLKQEALRKTQKLLDEASLKLAEPNNVMKTCLLVLRPLCSHPHLCRSLCLTCRFLLIPGTGTTTRVNGVAVLARWASQLGGLRMRQTRQAPLLTSPH